MDQTLYPCPFLREIVTAIFIHQTVHNEWGQVMAHGPKMHRVFTGKAHMIMGCKSGPDPSLFRLDMHLGREPAGVLLGPFVFHTFCTCTICIYPTKITSTPDPLLGRKKKSDLDMGTKKKPSVDG